MMSLAKCLLLDDRCVFYFMALALVASRFWWANGLRGIPASGCLELIKVFLLREQELEEGFALKATGLSDSKQTQVVMGYRLAKTR